MSGFARHPVYVFRLMIHQEAQEKALSLNAKQRTVILHKNNACKNL